MKLVAQEDDLISIVEFTPFLWEEAYSYGSYYTKNEFKDFFADKEVGYMYTPEFLHRIVFFREDKVSFDTRIVKRWYLGDLYQEVLTLEDEFFIDVGDEYLNFRILLYLKDY